MLPLRESHVYSFTYVTFTYVKRPRLGMEPKSFIKLLIDCTMCHLKTSTHAIFGFREGCGSGITCLGLTVVNSLILIVCCSHSPVKCTNTPQRARLRLRCENLSHSIGIPARMHLTCRRKVTCNLHTSSESTSLDSFFMCAWK